MSCNHLRFLTQYGTRIAFRNGMNSEMNPGKPDSSAITANLGSINLGHIDLEQVNLSREGVRAIRHCLHELANVFTGVMIAGDLLSLHMVEGPLQHYASDICIGGERGCSLVREIRDQLLGACDEAEAASQSAPSVRTLGPRRNLAGV